MTELDQIHHQERLICELRVRWAMAERRIAQQQLIIDRLHRRLERCEPSPRRAAESVFKGAAE